MKNLDLNMVKKALFDINVNSTGSNPLFLTNKEKGIQLTIQKSLDECQSYDIAVSYVVTSGLQRLIDNLNKDKYSRFLTTIDGYVTEPSALESLLTLNNTEVRVYVPNNHHSGFHAKTYMFKGESTSKLLVGSANISNRAFGSVHESSLLAEITENGKLFQEYSENFEAVWRSSRKLDKKFILNYKEEYFKYKNKKDNTIKIKDIKPNLMQKEALIELKKVRDQGKKKALIVASTGSGKTFLSAFDAKQFNPKKMLFIVHNRTILRKALKSYKRILKGAIRTLELKTSNINLIDRFNSIFTTPQTFKKHIQKFPKNYFDYIVIDEAHHTPAKTYQVILDYFEPKFLLGMTATPDRPDANIKAKDVYEKYDHIIPYEIRLHDAIENNLIAPFNYFGIGEDLASEKISVGNKVETILKNLKKFNHFGDKLKALAFVDRIETANYLAEEFVNKGIYAVAISGETDSEIVDSYLEELGDNEQQLKIIISVNKLNEGIDVPEINTILMLRKTQSPIIFIQQLGRGLRLSEPEKFVTVLDFVGNYAESFKILQGLMDNAEGTPSELKRDLLKPKNMLSNISLDEISRQRIYESIDGEMKGTQTILKKQLKDWVNKYGYVPSMEEYNRSTGKIDEILLHFHSWQDLKARLNYINLSDKALNLFRHISQGLLQSGTKKMIGETLNILKNKSGEITDEFLENYLLGKFKTFGTDKDTFFVKQNSKILLIVNDLFKNTKFKKEFNDFTNFISINLKNQDRIIHKNYRKLDIPFMAKRESLKFLMEGQFRKNNTIWCMPGLARKDSIIKRKYENKVLDETHILYLTKDTKNSIDIAQNKFKIELFIKHVDSKDNFLTYLGQAKILEDKGCYDVNLKHSRALVLKLENPMPKWMVKDYKF